MQCTAIAKRGKLDIAFSFLLWGNFCTNGFSTKRYIKTEPSELGERGDLGRSVTILSQSGGADHAPRPSPQDFQTFLWPFRLQTNKEN